MLCRNSVIREMQFKLNFLLWIVVEMLWFALQLVFISVIYSHVDRIVDWTQWQVVLLMGVSHLIQQIFTAFFFTNCSEFPEHVRTGRLDFLLLLPAPTRFLVSFYKLDLSGFINGITAIAVIVYAASKLNLDPTWTQILGFGALVLVGALLHYALLFMLITISFWTVRAQGIIFAYYNLFNIARLPDSAFRGFFKMFFTFALPMLLVANVPAKTLMSRLGSPWEMGVMFLVALVFLALSSWFWNFSLNRYTSASS